jgi:hypothetical protein
LIKIEVYNREITQESIEANSTYELLSDLGLIIDSVITKVAESEKSNKKEILKELTDLINEVWNELSKEEDINA